MVADGRWEKSTQTIEKHRFFALPVAVCHVVTCRTPGTFLRRTDLADDHGQEECGSGCCAAADR